MKLFKSGISLMNFIYFFFLEFFDAQHLLFTFFSYLLLPFLISFRPFGLSYSSEEFLLSQESFNRFLRLQTAKAQRAYSPYSSGRINLVLSPGVTDLTVY